VGAKTKIGSDAAGQPDDETTRRARFRDWIVRVRRLVKVLSQQLDHTVNEWDVFCADNTAIYFQGLPCQDSKEPLLPAIKRHFRTLVGQRNTLLSLAERCNDFAHDVGSPGCKDSLVRSTAYLHL
jgi:hypothetical protein